MVQFLLAVGSVGMLHQRFTDEIRRRRNGDGARRCLFCGRLSITDAAAAVQSVRAGGLTIGLLCVVALMGPATTAIGDEPALTLTAPQVDALPWPDSAQPITISETQARGSFQ